MGCGVGRVRIVAPPLLKVESVVRDDVPKLMTAASAICGLLPILLLRIHGTEIGRPLAIVMTEKQCDLAFDHRSSPFHFKR